MSALKLRDKRFLGYTLKASQNVSGIWMNEDEPGGPFICIAHRGVWTITVSIGKNKFEAEGPTERKARINFASKLTMIKEAIATIEKWEKRDS